MKYFYFFSLCFLFISSCDQQESLTIAELDASIYGRWQITTETFQEIKMTRTNRYGTFDKGFTFFEDMTLVERSDSGVCIDAGCIMENYNGTFSINKDNDITVSIKNLKGNVIYNLKFNVLDINTIEAIKY